MLNFVSDEIQQDENMYFATTNEIKERRRIQTDPNIAGNSQTNLLVFTRRLRIPALFTDLSDEMSISRCVQPRQIFTYVRQAPLALKSP